MRRDKMEIQQVTPNSYFGTVFGHQPGFHADAVWIYHTFSVSGYVGSPLVSLSMKTMCLSLSL